MGERLFVVLMFALLLLVAALPALPAEPAHNDRGSKSLGVVYADDDLALTLTPAPGEGHCQGSGNCGGG